MLTITALASNRVPGGISSPALRRSPLVVKSEGSNRVPVAVDHDVQQFVDGDGRLAFRAGGRTHLLDAPDVLACLADGRGDSLRAGCPGLRILSQTLPVAIEVTGAAGSGFIARRVARARGGTARVSPGAKSVIVGRAWYPLDRSSGEVVDGLLGASGIHLEDVFPLGRYLRLLADPLSGSFVVDCSDHEEPGADQSLVAFMAPPPGLKADLYPYQRIGSAFLRSRASLEVGALLADEMGLGKTMQVIALLLAERALGTSLVLAPASLLPNWNKELAKFAPSLDALVHAGPRRHGVVGPLMDHDVVIVTYETLISDEDMFRERVWNVVAADEAQRLRNPDSARSQIARRIPSRMRVAVTGTPVENSLADLWSVADYIIPNVLGDRDDFVEAFPDETAAARHLGNLMRPLSIRRKVAAVAGDLPRITQIQTLIPFDPADEAKHARLVASGAPFGAVSDLSLLCAHATDETADLADFVAKPKAEHAVALLDEILAEGQKALVFACYTKSVDRLAAAVHQRNPQAFVGILDGRLAPLSRQELIDGFAASTASGCLILNPAAGGVGLNITAANHVIHFTPNWNPAVTDQATARAFRLGQQRPVFVHHLAYQDSIEERALARGDWKRDLAAAVDHGLIDPNGGGA